MRKKCIRILAICLALGCLLALPAMADTEGGGTVTATALNLRTEPTLSAPILRIIPGGAFLLVEETADGWCKVVYNGTEGYVSAEFLSCSETLDGSYDYTATLTGDYVRLRAGASTDSAILGSYNTGTEFTVLGVSGAWLKVTNGTQTGYIRSDYLSYTDETGTTVTATTAETATTYSSGIGEQIVATAKEYLGTPYVWAGMSPSGFDCSGFVNYVYKLYGYSMNRVAQDIYTNDGVYVAKEDLMPGDLVFFGYSATSVTHVGMYIGNGQFIHASSSRAQVVITDLSQTYYTTMYVGAKRIV